MTLISKNADKIHKIAKPASDTEEVKCDNAIRMIKEAVSNHPELKKFTIRVIPQGSYHNNTNVRTESDVDICVKMYSYVISNLTKEEKDKMGWGTSTLSYSDYKELIWSALEKKFGDDVNRGKKCFEIKSNTYRVNADVVPSMEFRYYNKERTSYESGIVFFDKFGNKIVNFPEQHYLKGKQKNIETNHIYKKVVRVLKSCKYTLIDNGNERLEKISSFGIECAVYNVPNNYFNTDSLESAVKNVIAYIFVQTNNIDTSNKWKEVNGILPLFTDDRKFNHLDLNYFCSLAFDFFNE